MRKKQFKAESKKVLDMMINSIYTNREIFLRELISNASDAIDKLYFKSLTDDSVKMNRDDFFIKIDLDKENRTMTITDNGIGMTLDELESNLGTIAKSGSLDFKKDDTVKDDTEIIGQFGVGFYSAFMVADKVTVLSKSFGSDEANLWISEGADGYTVEPAEKAEHGTVITLYMKADTENENYSDFLETYRVENIVKKYSDYIRFPIKMDIETSREVERAEEDKLNEDGTEKEPEYETVVETQTINSMVPLWRKNKNEITDEEYNNFYHEKFYDYTDPLTKIHSKTEGMTTFDALLYIPKNPPYDYYTKNFEKGLQLYSNGVMIMDKCKELLPDYFSFVRGLVDSADLSLNVSRETLQQDHQVKLIAKTIEKKIKNELLKMMENNREDYEQFWKSFGLQIVYGVYDGYGANAENLKDLLLFNSSDGKYMSLKEYTESMGEEQKSIYYAAGESVEKCEMLPQVAKVLAKGYKVLYLTGNIDEFALQMMREYDSKKFVNVCGDGLDIDTDEEKEELKTKNEQGKELLEKMCGFLGDKVKAVKFTDSITKYPSCLTSEGMLSTEMEKVLNAQPGADGNVKAQTVLEISASHPVADKLATLDDEALERYTKLLYNQARLIGGLEIEDPAQFTELVASLM